MKDYKRLEAEMMYWRACYKYLKDIVNELDSYYDIQITLENIEEFTDLDVLEGFDGTQEYIDKCVKDKVLKKQKEREDYRRGYQNGWDVGYLLMNLLRTQDVQIMQKIQIMQKVQEMLEDKEKPFGKGFERGYLEIMVQKECFIENITK